MKMNLSARLERARIERGLAEGTIHSEEALRPVEAESEPEPAHADPISIELPPTGLAAVAPPPKPRPSLFSGSTAPTPESLSICPSCRAAGHLDMVDLVGHKRHFSCGACGAMWNVVDEDAASRKR